MWCETWSLAPVLPGSLGGVLGRCVGTFIKVLLGTYKGQGFAWGQNARWQEMTVTNWWRDAREWSTVKFGKNLCFQEQELITRRWMTQRDFWWWLWSMHSLSAASCWLNKRSSPAPLPPTLGTFHPISILLHQLTMSSMTPLSITLFVGLAHATNDTVVKGWVPEPNGRGTWSILWSCLVTIFICTWSVLHLYVQKQGRWRSFLRKCKWMLFAVLAPELILVWSVSHFLDARIYHPALVRYGGSEWTLTHIQFALSDGFETSNTDGTTKAVHPRKLIELVAKGEISRPPISEEELQSRSNSNWLVKFIAMLQVIWFALQTLFRVIQHLQVTPLELVVIAFVFCSIFTYILFWSKPQNVEYPISIPLKAIRSSPRSVEVPAELKHRTVYIIATVLMTFFGAIHCAAWHSPFPSRAEELSWRICATITTSMPVLASGALICFNDDDMDKYMSKNANTVLNGFAIIFITVLYAVPRLILIVLAFTALRMQPSDAYQTVNWTQYLPNFAPWESRIPARALPLSHIVLRPSCWRCQSLPSGETVSKSFGLLVAILSSKDSTISVWICSPVPWIGVHVYFGCTICILWTGKAHNNSRPREPGVWVLGKNSG